MSRPDDSDADKGVRDELLDAIRALRRLRDEELRLLRLIEFAIRKASTKDFETATPSEDSPLELPDWVSREVDSVLSEAFDVDASSMIDPDDADPSSVPESQETMAAVPPLSSYLLLGSANEWVCFPWASVERVDIHNESAGVEQSLSLRRILGQDETSRVSDSYCIHFAGGTGCITCMSVGGIMTLDESARRGVECVIVPGISGADGYVNVSLMSLVEAAALESPTPIPERQDKPGEAAPEPRLDESPIDRCQTGAAWSGSEDEPSSNRIDISEDRDEPSFEVGPAPEAGDPPAVVEDSTHRVPQGDPAAASPPFGAAVPTGLVAVRYLPARVGIARALRSRGWFLRETADLAEVPQRLRRVRYEAAFVEMVDDEIPDIIPALQLAAANGCCVIAVGSRLRARASTPQWELGEIPRLLYPFHESEIEKLLDSLRQGPRK